MDRDQKRAYDRAYHAKRSPEAKRKKFESQRNRVSKNLQEVRQYKADRGCSDCGERDPIVLDLDHIDRGSKKFTLSNAVRLGVSIEKILKEIEKCEVVCANCHRRRTARQLGWREVQILPP